MDTNAAIMKNAENVEKKKRKTPRVIRSLLGSVPGTVGAVIVVGVVLMAIFADVLCPHDPMKLNARQRLKPPSAVSAREGTPPNYLGTDSMGRDLLSRVILGSRVSIALGLIASVLGGGVGILVGMLSGYYGGKVDSFISWLVNMQMAFPFTLLAIFIMAIFGGGLDKLVIVLAWSAWVGYARVMRGQVMSVKEMEYVNAARVLGVRQRNILLRYILPNTLSPIIIVMTFTVASVILFEAQLSFLGLGVNPRIPTWGSILADGRAYIERAWWIATFPGIAIFVTVLGINLFGDWLRDFLDPRLKLE